MVHLLLDSIESCCFHLQVWAVRKYPRCSWTTYCADDEIQFLETPGAADLHITNKSLESSIWRILPHYYSVRSR